MLLDAECIERKLSSLSYLMRYLNELLDIDSGF